MYGDGNVKDRLAEVKTGADLELTPLHQAREFPPSTIDEFDKAHQPLGQRLDALDAIVVELQNLLSGASAQVSSSEFDACIKKFSTTLGGIKPHMEVVDKLVRELKKDPSHTGDHSVCSTMYDLSCKRLKSIMSRFDKAQSAYQANCREKIKRSYELSGVSVTDEDVNRMLEDGNVTIMMDDAVEAERKKEALRNIEERHNDIKKLEDALRGMNDIFTQLNILVQEQEETLCNILTRYNNTGEYIASAGKALDQAVAHKVSASKKKLIIGAIVGVILVIIIIVLSVVLTRNR